ncbi:MAG: iron-containing alcohol dehydrogenase [Candidatus Omnitrophica bacterium]|nr:iron-containing alcohol dehydrogenase [Candidatus Omnitrophota bacterium]
MFSYEMPSKIVFGKGSVNGLGAAADAFGADKVLVFSGGASAEVSGVLLEVERALVGRKIRVFRGIRPDPEVSSLNAGLKLCREFAPGMVVSAGGGSVIDYGKAVAAISSSGEDAGDVFRKKRLDRPGTIPFVAIPTTFGTSSEITPYAVMTDKASGIKVTLADGSMFPARAYIDPLFTLTMPRPLVAASCCDLLSHAVEAYWNRNATPITDCLAIEAVKRFMSCYEDVCGTPPAPEAMERICVAGMFAGMAFSNTRTTASHSISYPLTVGFGIPHGVACMLTLGEMLLFNAKEESGKIRVLCDVMGCPGPEEAREMITMIMTGLGVKTRLSEYGITPGDIEYILDRGFTPERMLNNPVHVSRDDLRSILERIF